MSRYRHALTELFKRGESGFNEEEQVNHIVYQLVDQYNLKSIAVLFFPGNGDTFEVFAHRGLSRNFIKSLYSSKEKEIIRAAKKGELIVVAKEPETSNPGYTFEHATAYRVGMPLRYLDTVQGVLFLDGDDEGIVTESAAQDFFEIGGVIASYLKVKRLNSHISRVPGIDPLSGL